jgi:hypothetical protein
VSGAPVRLLVPELQRVPPPLWPHGGVGPSDTVAGGGLIRDDGPPKLTLGLDDEPAAKTESGVGTSITGRPMRKIFVLAGLATLVATPSVHAVPVVFSGIATSAAGITPFRDAFRTTIGGGTVAGANGSFGGVRREINWDGVPDAFSAPNNLPANFFNVNSPRGVVFSTPGTGFQVSANASVAPIDFGNINATYPGTFAPFSPQRLFTPLGSNVTDVTFFIPGTATPAVTSAFGSIFSDVDLAGSSLQFFDLSNNSLGTFSVPALVGNETFAFLGVMFDSPLVNRVRITSGNAALGAATNDGGDVDVGVMDDFLYAEPQAVPETDSLTLFGTGALALAGRMRRRFGR